MDNKALKEEYLGLKTECIINRNCLVEYLLCPDFTPELKNRIKKFVLFTNDYIEKADKPSKLDNFNNVMVKTRELVMDFVIPKGEVALTRKISGQEILVPDVSGIELEETLKNILQSTTDKLSRSATMVSFTDMIRKDKFLAKTKPTNGLWN